MKRYRHKMNIDEIASIKQRYDKPIIKLWEDQTYFALYEIVSEEVYQSRGDNSIELFSENALRTIIELRDLFAYPITINNWKWGGKWQYRGFRPASFYPGRVSYSQHLLGNAFDFDVKGHNAEECRTKIIEWKKEGFLKYLTGLEDDVNWVHVDCRISQRLDENGLFIFKP